MHRPDCREAVGRRNAAVASEHFTSSVSAADAQQSATFDRGDVKRAGVRRALTVCRTAL